MRPSIVAMIVGSSLAASLQADLLVRARETFAGRSVIKVEYYKGSRRRTDPVEGGVYWIVDSATRRTTVVDPARREFWIRTFPQRPQATDPSKTISIEIESRDTGERRQMFGYPARRFITIERRHTEFPDKPPSEFLETVTDGWYLEAPFWTPKPHVAVAVLTADNPSHPNVPPKIEVTRLGPTPKGLPVWEKRGDSLMEVTELSHAELDPKLFEPPSGFRRAIHPMPDEQLSWSEKILFGWQQFEDWIGSSTAPWKK